MKNVYGGYARLDIDSNDVTYFAGANTAAGFTGSYSDIADERKLERVYVIKGGSGTGKSTLIRKAADAAKAAGYRAEYYLCGSDPYSLDCAVLDGRIAVLDGTAPHIRDMVYPGAASDLVDVSQFWDSEVLERQRGEIIENSALKTAYYESAYRYMRAADAVDAERTALSGSLFCRGKASAYAARFIKKLGKPESDEDGRTNVRYTGGITMRGAFFIPVFEYMAENVFAVSDVLGCAAHFMELLSEQISCAGFDSIISRLPLSGHISGIFIPHKSVAVTVSTPVKPHKTINMARFISEDIPEEIRGRIKLASKITDSCMAEALSNLSRASNHHFALEQIYKQAMDFASLESYTTRLCADITARLMG